MQPLVVHPAPPVPAASGQVLAFPAVEVAFAPPLEDHPVVVLLESRQEGFRYRSCLSFLCPLLPSPPLFETIYLNGT